MNYKEQRLSISESYCKQFFKNVHWLCKERGLSLRGLVVEMGKRDFKINKAVVSHYAGHRKPLNSTRWNFKSASIVMLVAFSEYFECSMIDLLSRDLETESDLQG